MSHNCSSLAHMRPCEHPWLEPRLPRGTIVFNLTSLHREGQLCALNGVMPVTYDSHNCYMDTRTSQAFQTAVFVRLAVGKIDLGTKSCFPFAWTRTGVPVKSGTASLVCQRANLTQRLPHTSQPGPTAYRRSSLFAESLMAGLGLRMMSPSPRTERGARRRARRFARQ